MRDVWLWLAVGIGLAWLFGMGIILASAQHGHWVDHYRTADGRLCCGETDCQPTHLRVITANAVRPVPMPTVLP